MLLLNININMKACVMESIDAITLTLVTLKGQF